MKKLLLAILLLPVLSIAQAPKKKSVHKTERTLSVPVVTKQLDGFLITGYTKGFPDGTPVSLLNSQTGASEAAAVVTKNKFVLTGKMPEPDFRLIMFNNQPTYIALFLDNSDIKITVNKDSLLNAVITGSPSQADFAVFNIGLQPYQYLFADDASYDSAASADAMKVCNDFVMAHHNSYVAPLAAIRYMQLADDNIASELLYNQLGPDVKRSLYGKYMASQIAEAKNNGVGTIISDFTQTDTAGNAVSLSSFKGKYLLLDFWASWCHPCRMENPNVVAAYNKFKGKNFTILSVSLDQDKSQWLYAITQDGLNAWTHVSDLQGWRNAVAVQYRIVQIPQNLLIDPNGIVIGKNLRGGALDRKLSKILR